jgi:hypothetical protein
MFESPTGGELSTTVTDDRVSAAVDAYRVILASPLTRTPTATVSTSPRPSPGMAGRVWS